MESLKFTITTKMEKEDLKKFMYIVTFFRKKSTIPMLVTVSLLGSLWVNYAWGNVTTPGFFVDNNYAYIYYRSYFFQDRKKSETAH